MKLPLLTLMLASLSTLSATVLMYTEAPGIQTTHLGGTVIESFNSLTPGLLGPYLSAVGTYSAGGSVQASDIFGGANMTSYMAVGPQSGAASYSLTFNGLQSFFGFYSLATDSQNLVQFYNGTTLVASFTGSDLTAGLSSAYFGNPNTSTDPLEKFVYVNFLSDNVATNFNRVVFSSTNPTGTGFETDNHTILAGSSGGEVSTPEPSTIAMLIPALGGLFAASRCRR